MSSFYDQYVQWLASSPSEVTEKGDVIQNEVMSMCFEYRQTWALRTEAILTQHEYRQKMYVTHKDANLRRCAAKNKAASIAVLKIAAKDKNWKVRRVAALNANITVDLLKVLVKDKKEEVRNAAMRRLNKMQ